MKFTFPTNLMLAKGNISLVGEVTAQYGKNIMLVTGQNSTKKTGVLDMALSLLQKAGVNVFVFDEVTQNPFTTTATKGAEIAREKNIDCILGIGGGSIMDCAKAIAFLAVNDGDINDYIFMKKVGTIALPIILVPTTCGTGSEANGFSVLTNPENGDKKSLNNTCIIPKVALVDPDLMKTMPSRIFASVSFDACCHLMEAYLCKTHQKLCDVLILDALKTLVKEAPLIYKAGEGSDEQWEAVTYASTIGGMVIYNAGVCLPHALEHPLSGLKDVVHGKGLASILPEITKQTAPHLPDRYGQLSQIFGGKDANDCAAVIAKFIDDMGLSCNISDFGIVESDLDWLTDNAFKVSAYSMGNHPVQFSRDEI